MNSKAVVVDLFAHHLGHYGQWRNRLVRAISEYQRWYESQDNDDARYELRLHELVDGLRTDKLTLAVVGEFSRGKTELINALFFSDYNRRLLPSQPGRTTMCPTEILHEEHRDPCIRLLPIETRRSALTIGEHKKHTVNWTNLPLNLESSDEMAETLRETMRSKTVDTSYARDLGIYYEDSDVRDDQVEIPVWRHAVVNYPHPLLKQGLVILDTPGLNALGTEPELTLNMLPAAHAILFVLAADTGVTKTDLNVWRDHVCLAARSMRSRLVTLNKIDTFWDDLFSDSDITNFITRQIDETQKLLEVDREAIFAVSAQKGLVGKIKKDEKLVAKSGLPKLEAKLSEDIVAYKQRFMRDKIVNDVGNVIQSSHNELSVMVEGKRRELAEVQTLHGKSSDVIEELTQKLRLQQQAYEKQIQNFHVTRNMLSDQLKRMLRRLDMKRFDDLLFETRDSMRGSWTTQGLRHGISRFFTETQYVLDLVEKESEAICGMVDKIYMRFHTECGLPKTRPVKFSVSPFVRQFLHLHQEAETFRDSPTMMMMEQHYVIKKFFMSMAISARAVFHDCRVSARNWGKAVLKPIRRLIIDHQKAIERRLGNLDKLQNSHTSLNDKVEEGLQELNEMEKSLAFIEEILEMLYEEGDETDELISDLNPACG